MGAGLGGPPRALHKRLSGQKCAKGALSSPNFKPLAHSGLEWNLVEVRKGADGIEIRYDEEGIETVRKLCRSGLANIP
jgi:hypothetical protein